MVERSILVEIKAIDPLLPIHEAQLLTYLRLGRWKIRLLINFNVELLKYGCVDVPWDWRKKSLYDLLCDLCVLGGK